MGVRAISIREAALADLEALLPLVAAYRAFYERQPDAKGERRFIEAHLRSGSSKIYLAELSSEIAGFMQLFKTYSTVHLCSSWILEDLFVDPRFRNAGVATALLERAVEHARGDGAGGMFLETARDNARAQSVYERAGWTREAQFLKYNAPLP